MNPENPSNANVRGYDCRKCKIHFEAETSQGDACEFDPDCPQCGDPTGFDCTPCLGDPRNVTCAPTSFRGPGEEKPECLFPRSVRQGIVALPVDA